MTSGYLENEARQWPMRALAALVRRSIFHAADGAAARDAIEVLTMRRSSGTQEPQLVPHFKLAFSKARRSSAPPVQAASCSSIAESVTFRQVQICRPRGR